MTPLHRSGRWKKIAGTMCIILPFAALPPLDGEFTTIASWYGPGFQGHKTASGERFDENKLTAASKTLAFGTKLTVKNPRNGRTVDVVINDRGPFVRGRGIDLSRAAARNLGIGGTAQVVCYACGASPERNGHETDQYTDTEPGTGVNEQAEVAEAKPFIVNHTVQGTPLITRADDAFVAAAPSEDQKPKPIRHAHEPVEHPYVALNSGVESAPAPKPISHIRERVKHSYVALNPADQTVQIPKPISRIRERVEHSYVALNPADQTVQIPKPAKHVRETVKRSFAVVNPDHESAQAQKPIQLASDPVEHSIFDSTYIYDYPPTPKPVQDVPATKMQGTAVHEHATRIVAYHRSHRASRGKHDKFQTYVATARIKGRRFERAFDHMTGRLAHSFRGITSSVLAAL